MRIKKLIKAKKLANSNQLSHCEFESEINPFRDDSNFDKNFKIGYKLHFPNLNGKFLLDLVGKNIPKNVEENVDDIYDVTIVFPEAFFLEKYIEMIGIDHVYNSNLRTFVYEESFTNPMRIFQPSTSFTINLSNFTPSGNSGLVLRLKIKSALHALMPSPTEPCNLNGQILDGLKRKKFVQEYNLGRLLKSEQNLRDFTIIVGNFQFRVHKCVLSAQSSVFAQMLTVQMDERQNSNLKISDISEEAVEYAIQFMYTGELSIDIEDNCGPILTGLYVFAQKYNMVNLKWAVFESCLKNKGYFNDKPEEKQKLFQIATLHETEMKDLNSFLAIFGPYMVDEK